MLHNGEIRNMNRYDDLREDTANQTLKVQVMSLSNDKSNIEKQDEITEIKEDLTETETETSEMNVFEMETEIPIQLWKVVSPHGVYIQIRKKTRIDKSLAENKFNAVNRRGDFKEDDTWIPVWNGFVSFLCVCVCVCVFGCSKEHSKKM